MTLPFEAGPDAVGAAEFYVAGCGDSVAGLSRIAEDFMGRASVLCGRLLAARVARLLEGLFDSACVGLRSPGVGQGRGPVRGQDAVMWAWDMVRHGHVGVLSSGVRDPENDLEAELVAWWSPSGSFALLKLIAEHVEYRAALEGVEGVASYPWWSSSSSSNRVGSPAWRELSQHATSALRSPGMSWRLLGHRGPSYVNAELACSMVRGRRDRSLALARRLMFSKMAASMSSDGSPGWVEASEWLRSDVGSAAVAGLAAEVEPHLRDIDVDACLAGEWGDGEAAHVLRGIARER